MLKSNIVSYIKLRDNMNMKEIEKDQALCEADVYILEIGYQLYLKKISLDVILEDIKLGSKNILVNSKLEEILRDINHSGCVIHQNILKQNIIDKELNNIGIQVSKGIDLIKNI